jgi:LmbE family N-acetylglucosaminyl deacetylase
MNMHDEFLAKQRLLVVAPHADDETFGCAGTIARMRALGAEVYVIVASVGTVAHYGVKDDVSGDVRSNELESVMKYLDVNDYDILYKSDQIHLRLDTIARRDLVSLIEKDSKLAIDRVKPTMLAVPAVSYNQDHEVVFRACFTACRPHLPQYKSFQKIFVAYDNPAISWSTEREKFHPNFYIDISDHLDKKLHAVKLHASQAKASPHHASVESVEYLAKVRGREISVNAAEAYMCYRFVL